MTISVIIPTLNEEQALGQTLAHLPPSQALEIIIVDGGSRDRTLEVAKAFCTNMPSAHIVGAPTGRARQMNEGARVSRGDVLLFLHADTQIPHEAPRIIELALANPAVVGGRFDVRFDTHSGWGQLISTFMNWRSRTSGIATGDQAIFVRRHIFERVGGFADIPLMEDIDFSRRLKRVGPMAALRHTVTTSFRRWEQQGPLRTILLMWVLRFLYWAGVSPSRLSRWYKVVR
ncbi:MAG: TIGR04283 family arsenosugar biosynthesis glycosyltransferase [Nitrospira sp.]|nr:TIGR04283 family arsenosugar biosynthesis glycosyltransferase [Nitrospira sp.]MDH4304993.1 TIGR04283 family arsenosugar biosynthesis glycosyltransferase [Nitrospira sp.]MDH5195160.1 TIGR04283 family arsenosugar biosynthesis glycosyltransferase [Nitrospira sp.]